MVWYIAVLPLLLAVIAVAKRISPTRDTVTVYTVIIVISLGRALSLPVFDWINQLPLLSLGNPERLRLFVTFGLCVLAGIGADVLRYQTAATSAKLNLWLMRMLAGIVAFGLVILLLGNLVVPRLRPVVVEQGRRQVDIEYARQERQRETHPRSLDEYYARVDKLADGLVAAFAARNVFMYSSALWAALAWAMLARHRSMQNRQPELLGTLLLACTLGDLYFFGARYNPIISRRDFYPVSEELRQKVQRSDLARSIAIGKDMVPDTHMMVDVVDVRGFDFRTVWLDEYISLIPERMPWFRYGLTFENVTSPLLRVLNVKYVIAHDASVLEANRQEFQSLETVDQITVGTLRQVQPRAFMVYDAVIASSDAVISDALRQQPDAVYRRAFLSDASAPRVTPHSESRPENSVRVESYAPQGAVWNVSTAANGYLLVTDAYYPGWNAYVDGVATPVYRVNLAFRGIYLGPGSHRVELRYEPRSFRIGATITAMAVAIAAVMIGISAVSLRTGRSAVTGSAA
jgi:hypothetical protein